jgi:Ferritin-like domain
MHSEDESFGGKGKAVDRRAFVRGVGVAGLGVAGAAFVGGKLGVLDRIPGINKAGLASAAVQAGAITDTDILNFALNLEYLEAEFYTVATTGKTIEQSGIAVSGTGNSGPTTGGNTVNLTNSSNETELTGQLKAVVEEITYDEQQHVLPLRSGVCRHRKTRDQSQRAWHRIPGIFALHRAGSGV